MHCVTVLVCNMLTLARALCLCLARLQVYDSIDALAVCPSGAARRTGILPRSAGAGLQYRIVRMWSTPCITTRCAVRHRIKSGGDQVWAAHTGTTVRVICDNETRPRTVRASSTVLDLAFDKSAMWILECLSRHRI